MRTSHLSSTASTAVHKRTNAHRQTGGGDETPAGHRVWEHRAPGGGRYHRPPPPPPPPTGLCPRAYRLRSSVACQDGGGAAWLGVAATASVLKRRRRSCQDQGTGTSSSGGVCEEEETDGVASARHAPPPETRGLECETRRCPGRRSPWGVTVHPGELAPGPSA